jgi:dTDP-4-amino-4,6-dideoxygalactose transaminase
MAATYDELLNNIEDVTPVDRGRWNLHWRHALHLYQVTIEASSPLRDRVVARVQAGGIGATVHYVGVNHHPAYRTSKQFPVSDWASESLVTLPLHLHLDNADLARVARELAGAVVAMQA